MLHRLHPRRGASLLLVAILVLDLMASSSSAPLAHHDRRALSPNSLTITRASGPLLQKRDPPADPSQGPVASTTPEAPPSATTNPPQTTTVPPTTTPPSTTTTTTTTTTSTTTTKPETTEPSVPSSSSTKSPGKKPTTHLPSKPGSPGQGTTATTATLPPSSTPTNDDSSSGTSVLPIVLGAVLGIGALIGAGVFFFVRFRKSRRFDSKRPLTFLALSLDDPTSGESASSRAAGTDAIYDPNRPISTQPSVAYTPPAMASLLGSNNRFSYQAPSEHSNSTGVQFAQWSQDDENAALVGGFTQEHDPFVATSMMQLNPSDPLHSRYSRQLDLQPGSPTTRQENLPLRAVNADVPTSPLSTHSNVAAGEPSGHPSGPPAS